MPNPTPSPTTDDYAAQIRDKWLDERIGCWCEPYRKPCAYHEGMLDGTDIAAQFFLSQLREQRERSHPKGRDCARTDEVLENYRRRSIAAERTVREQREALERIVNNRHATDFVTAEAIALAALAPDIKEGGE